MPGPGDEYERTLEDVVETLENNYKTGIMCTLLVGAGCSVRAGIPLASGFVEEIRKKFPRAYERAKEKTYAHCMAELSPSQRRKLLAEYIDKARVNWAHIAIAQLIRKGYVDRVLTTNFDPLLAKACALAGVYPAIYDLAASQHFKAEWVGENAILHLHGQRNGFVTLNAPDEMKRHSDALAPVFEDARRGRTWIVIGYSGESDPVFGHVALVPTFDDALYWVGYGKGDPPKHVSREILKPGKFAYFVRGHDADGFLVALCQKLGIFPPDFVRQPLEYVEAILADIASFSPLDPGPTANSSNAGVSLVSDAQRIIREAREARRRERALQSGRDEGETEEISVDNLILSGDTQEVITRLEAKTVLSAEDAEKLASAYVSLALDKLAHVDAPEAALAEMFPLLHRLDQGMARASEFAPRSPSVWYSWGFILDLFAGLVPAEERIGLWDQAAEKFSRAFDVGAGVGAATSAALVRMGQAMNADNLAARLRFADASLDWIERALPALSEAQRTAFARIVIPDLESVLLPEEVAPYRERAQRLLGVAPTDAATKQVPVEGAAKDAKPTS